MDSWNDPQKRALTTEHGKHMFLHSDSIGFDAESAGNQLILGDEAGIQLESSKKVRIFARKNITLKAKSVVLKTPQEMRMVRR